MKYYLSIIGDGARNTLILGSDTLTENLIRILFSKFQQ